jgi:ubiquinone/menaquinone biosynthesis C-methylase UbiE
MERPSEQWSTAFELSSLDGMRAYEESLVEPMFSPWAELLLDRLDPSPGEQFLDVATGPGTVARLAAVRVGVAGAVLATDLSDAMLTLAGRKDPLEGAAVIEYRRSPAAPLDAPDAAFDAASCQQGLQFFPDRPAALGELHRALRPGGRLGLAVWSAIESCPPFACLAAAIGDVLGAEPAERYRDGPWGFHQPAKLTALLQEAGFRRVTVEETALPVRFAGGAAQLELSLAASGVNDDIVALPPEGRLALTAAIASRLAPLTDDYGAVCSQLTSQVALAIA